MKINIKATNLDLTRAINDYVNKRLSKIDKLLHGELDSVFYVEVAKTTNHHKQGEFFKAEFNIDVPGNKFYVFSEKEDLYKAIDAAYNDLARQIKGNKDREKTLFKRGATSIKKMIKGLSKRNPFTSKY